MYTFKSRISALVLIYKRDPYKRKRVVVFRLSEGECKGDKKFEGLKMVIAIALLALLIREIGESLYQLWIFSCSDDLLSRHTFLDPSVKDVFLFSPRNAKKLRNF